ERDTARTEWSKVSRGQFKELMIDVPRQQLDHDALLDAYVGALDTDVFHHTSHGNVRCSTHRRRAPSMDLATPRFPLRCLCDVELVSAFCRSCGTLFQGHRLERTVLAQRAPRPSALK